MGGKQILTSHLTFKLDESINESVLPTMLSTATITPIFKIDEILDRRNYRPISITKRSLKSLKNVFIGKLQLTLKKKISSLHSNLVLGKGYQ